MFNNITRENSYVKYNGTGCIKGLERIKKWKNNWDKIGRDKMQKYEKDWDCIRVEI